MRSLPDVNRAFAEIDLPIELVRGEGYHYFVYDDGTPTGFETESVAVPYFNQMAPSRWHRDGLQFYLNTKAKLDARRNNGEPT